MPSILRALALGALAITGAACFTDNPGFPPQHARFHYPIAGAITPDGNFLFVVNSDFNLQFNAGTVNVVNLRDVRAMIHPGQVVPAMAFVGNDAGVQPEAQFIPATNGTVQIHPFATSATLSTVPGHSPSELLRLYVSVRGDGTLTWIDVDPSTGALNCNAAPGDGLCGAEHRVGHDPTTSGYRMLTLPALPIAASVINEPNANFIAIAHQEQPNSHVSLFVDGGSGPKLAHFVGNLTSDLNALFVANPPGTEFTPNDPATRPYWYALSRDNPVINHVRVVPQDPPDHSYLYVPQALPFAGVSGDMGIRDVVRDPCTPTIAYATSRAGATSGTGTHSPDALLRMDISDPTTPVITDTMVVPAGPSHLVAIDPSGTCNGHPILYVVNYDARELFVVDSRLWQPIDQVRTQNGPHVPIPDPCIGRHDEVNCPDGPRNFLYLIDFAAMVVEVIDIDPTSPTYHRAVFTIGDIEPAMVSL